MSDPADRGAGRWVRRFAIAGAVFALLAVAAGAFGAHALRARLGPELLAVFETGARYQMYHALALFAAAIVLERWPSRAGIAAGIAFSAGILLFSGSLYLLALTGARWLGAVTPFGGFAFLAGWACLVWCAARGRKSLNEKPGRPDEHACHR